LTDSLSETVTVSDLVRHGKRTARDDVEAGALPDDDGAGRLRIADGDLGLRDDDGVGIPGHEQIAPAEGVAPVAVGAVPDDDVGRADPLNKTRYRLSGTDGTDQPVAPGKIDRSELVAVELEELLEIELERRGRTAGSSRVG
jgi:hypothetical protein